jgi:hypothetical protein
MKLLGKLFGRSKPTAASTVELARCPHTTLTPRWGSLAEMGQEDKISGYSCDGCSQRFTPAEGRALLRSEAARLQEELHRPV